jgi:hypothetical protein
MCRPIVIVRSRPIKADVNLTPSCAINLTCCRILDWAQPLPGEIGPTQPEARDADPKAWSARHSRKTWAPGGQCSHNGLDNSWPDVRTFSVTQKGRLPPGKLELLIVSVRGKEKRAL